MSEKKEETSKRILLSRTDKIGDLILTTPAIASVRKRYPDAYIAVLINSYNRDLLKGNEDIDEIIDIDKVGFFKLCRKLRRNCFDSAVIFLSAWRPALAAFFAGIPLRIGPASQVCSIFFNKRVYQHRSRVKKHEADYNLELVSYIGASMAKTETRLFIDSKDKSWAEGILGSKEKSGSRILVGIHPGGYGSAFYWPEENFRELLCRVGKGFSARILVTGKEEGLRERLCSTVPVDCFVPGDISLGRLAALIAMTDLFISNSTGPLHIAVALGVPTISFFPPLKVMSCKRWGPYSDKNIHRVLTPDVEECNVCKKKKCIHYDCMKKIQVDYVYNIVQDILSINKR